ncbi:hypothetical protein NST14_01980 [Bacillus sp. FSL W8-0519]|uniref:rolling circle replication-associated protein n=1 Tax=Bacillus TaxID=1386 RepID=UPI001E550B86|nr:hypothetical protein [Bacillus paranthracis]MBL3756649.1 hypothetical protein [Bacillus cereus]MCC2412267.1 hypothetical protein [Bacillus paranthracis]
MKQPMKATISNKYIEVTQQSYSPCVSRTSLGGRKSLSHQSSKNYETNLKISTNRARKKIRRLLECNFPNQYAFLTLTFASSKEMDITDIDGCYEKFIYFKKRLSRYLNKKNLPKFKYLGVTEFQDKNRQGAIHYHIICNLTEIPLKELKELWQYGWVSRRTTTSDATENETISNYLKKGITDERLNGRKKYFHSHGLKKPIIVEIESSEEFYSKLDKCQSTLIIGGTYQSPFSGETKYENYYVKNAEELIKYVQEL